MLRGLLVWTAIMAAETLHGILRQMLLAPHIGEIAAERVGWPVASLIVLAIATATARWIELRRIPELLSLGLAWAALTGVFEIAIGLLRGFDWQRIAAEINPLAGGLMLYSLAIMLVAPLLAARLRRL